MSHHHSIPNRRLEPHLERAIRIFLRFLGGFALAVCIIFWLTLLMQ
jgi:hypothetical protein